MKNYDFETRSSKKLEVGVSDNDFDEILEQDWLDAEDDIKCPIKNNSGEGIEPERYSENDSTAVADIKLQESPKVGGSFDLSELRLSRDYAEGAGVKKLLTTIPVNKPNRQRFFRVNPDPNYQLPVAVIELKEENETYLIHPRILNEIPEDFKNKLLAVGVTRQGVLFVWPIGMPDSDGKYNPWHQSAREAAELAKTTWIRMVSNRELGAYEIYVAEGNLGDPKFPDLSMEEIIDIAFKDKIISDLDHPLLKQLRGGV